MDCSSLERLLRVASDDDSLLIFRHAGLLNTPGNDIKIQIKVHFSLNDIRGHYLEKSNFTARTVLLKFGDPNNEFLLSPIMYIPSHGNSSTRSIPGKGIFPRGKR